MKNKFPHLQVTNMDVYRVLSAATYKSQEK